MKYIIMLVLFCFVSFGISQLVDYPSELPFNPNDILDINGIWSGGKFVYTEDYMRWGIEIKFQYFVKNNAFGVCSSNLLARTLGGGLDSWEVYGIFGRRRDSLLVYPTEVRIGNSVVLPDSMRNSYMFYVIFLNDSVAYIPGSVFGDMSIKKQKSEERY